MGTHRSCLIDLFSRFLPPLRRPRRHPCIISALNIDNRGLWVEKSKLRNLQQEHSSCPGKESLAKLNKLQSEHTEGLWVEKSELRKLQDEHSSCPDKETFAKLNKLQSEHAGGLWVENDRVVALQKKFDDVDQEHRLCPDQNTVTKLQ